MEQVLLVRYQAKPDGREAFVEAMNSSGLLEQIRSEEGCLLYDYYYCAKDPDQLLLVERWASQEALALHAAQPHMAKLRELKERYLVSTELERLNPQD